MKFTIEIDEEQVKQAVMELIIKNAVEEVKDDVFNERGYYSKRVYVDAIKAAVRETVKGHVDDIVNRATNYAGEYIGKKGLKKMIDDGAI